MTEAVIVATARSPIGRANKGSLRDLRPDDLTATIVRAALDKVPALDPHTVDDLLLGCGLPGRGERQQHGPGRQRAQRHGRRPRSDHHPLLRVVGADHTDGLPRDQGRRGGRDHLRRRGDRLALRQGHLRPLARHPQPAVRRRRGPQREAGRGRPGPFDRLRTTLGGPARGRRPPRHLRRDGPDGGERRSPPRPVPPGARRVRRPVPEPRREGHRRRLLGPGDHPGLAARRLGRLGRRRPPQGSDLRGHRGAGPGLPARRPGHRRQLLRAERRCRRRRGDVRHEGRRARPHPAGPDRRDGGLRPVPGGDGPRTRRGQPSGPRARRDEHRRHRPRRDQRGVRRAGRAVVPGPAGSTWTGST